jgi:hypothetical protein
MKTNKLKLTDDFKKVITLHYSKQLSENIKRGIAAKKLLSKKTTK